MTYYIPWESVNGYRQCHTLSEPTIKHPHNRQCACGWEDTSADPNCYTCCPSSIRFDINIPGSSDSYHVQEINTGRYGEAKIDCPDPLRDGYTFLGWASEKDAAKAAFDNGDVFYIKPGCDKSLYAVWQRNTLLSGLSGFVGLSAKEPVGIAFLTRLLLIIQKLWARIFGSFVTLRSCPYPDVILKPN